MPSLSLLAAGLALWLQAGCASQGPVGEAGGARGRPAAIARYRLLLEIDGEAEVRLGSEEQGVRRRKAELLELHYRVQPVAAASPNESAEVLVLEALHYRIRTGPPAHEREIELARDRLRTRAEGKVAIDLRGAQPREKLTPRMLLGRPFALLRLDRNGEPIALLLRGPLPARRFLAAFPLRRALLWSRLARPPDTSAPGARWAAPRIPPELPREAAVALELHYQLAGQQPVDGVPCAWILIQAKKDASGLRSEVGAPVERVLAKVEGQAWVERERRWVRKLVLDEDVRAAFSRGEGSRAEHHRIRYRGHLELRLEDESAARAATWADGSARFGQR